MKTDPVDAVEWETIKTPPTHGPGSGKDAWVRYAIDLGSANLNLSAVINEQSAVIRSLRAELSIARQRIEERKPRGGRPRISDQKQERLEADIASGLSRRSIAKRHGVSAMTVTRVAQRVALRAAQEQDGL